MNRKKGWLRSSEKPTTLCPCSDLAMLGRWIKARNNYGYNSNHLVSRLLQRLHFSLFMSSSVSFMANLFIE